MPERERWTYPARVGAPPLPAGEAAPGVRTPSPVPGARARVHRLASVEKSTTGTSRHDSARRDETGEPRRAVELSDAQVSVAGGHGHRAQLLGGDTRGPVDV